MNVSSADLSTVLNRILDAAADNLRFAKILVQMGLDPNNITYDALFNRIMEIVVANITLANMFALVGAVFFVATLLTQTMVPLRVANMAGLRVLRWLRCARRRRQDVPAVSPAAPDQRRSPAPDAHPRQEGARGHAGRHLDGMAKAVHDRTQISQGRYRLQKGRCRQRDVLDAQRQFSGQGNRRRAAAGAADGRTRLPFAEQPADGEPSSARRPATS